MKLYAVRYQQDGPSGVETKSGFVVCSNEFEVEPSLRRVVLGVVSLVSELCVIAQAWDPASNLPILVLPEVKR